MVCYKNIIKSYFTTAIIYYTCTMDWEKLMLIFVSSKIKIVNI